MQTIEFTDQEIQEVMALFDIAGNALGRRAWPAILKLSAKFEPTKELPVEASAAQETGLITRQTRKRRKSS